jgi:hypothetical protein
MFISTPMRYYTEPVGYDPLIPRHGVSAPLDGLGTNSVSPSYGLFIAVPQLACRASPTSELRQCGYNSV